MSLSKRKYTPGSRPTGWAGGWDVERMRLAIEWHDRGRFTESWAAAQKVSQWAHVFGAMRQRISPTQRFPRCVEGGSEGIDKVARDEAEALFVGKGRDLGPAFPSLWGTIECLALMGFAWWQSYDVVQQDGTVAPQTELWPPDATWYDVSRRQWVALTQEEGAIDIDPNDPRWTLIADKEEPWRAGAIRAVGIEFVDAAFARNDRSSYSDEHGRPKPIAVLPPDTKVTSNDPAKPAEGDAVYDTLQVLRESEAGAVFAHGTTIEQLEPSAEAVTLFESILNGAAMAVAIAILGTDGTMSKGTGGVYASPMFEGVAEDTVAADVAAVSKGATTVLERFRTRNYAEAETPLVAVIKMPDTKRDARTKSLSERMKAFHETIKAERENGFVITQERVNQIAEALDLEPPTLASTPKGAQSFAYDQENGVITINDRLEELGRPAVPGRGEMTIPAYRAWLAKQSEAPPAQETQSS